MIDSHIHLWDVANKINSWVIDNVDLRLRQSFGLEDFLTNNANSTGVVVVESVDEQYSLDEVEWIEQHVMTKLYELKLRHVAHINMQLDHELFVLNLNRFKPYPWVIGFRDILSFSPDNNYSPCEDDITLNKAKLDNFYLNVSTLKEKGYILNCQMYPSQLLRVYDIIADTKVGCVIDHCALADFTSLKYQEWRAVLKNYASIATFKFSGFDINDNQKNIERILSDMIKYIAPEGLIFGSNFPVTEESVINQSKYILKKFYNNEDQHKIFYQNSHKIFGF